MHWRQLLCTCSLLLGLLLAQAPGAAAEPAPDAAAATVALHRQAGERLDLWTLLQCEDFLQQLANPPRYHSFFKRGGRCIGSTLRGFPSRVVDYFDRGDELLVLGDALVWRIAADGRPLDTLRQLPFAPQRWAFSADGRYLGLAVLEGHKSKPQCRLAVVDLDAGAKTVLQERFNLQAPADPALGYGLDGRLCVADDGSGVAVAVASGEAAGQACLWLWRDTEKKVQQQRSQGLRDPGALGQAGAWLLARAVAEPHPWLLQAPGQEARRLPSGEWEAGAGRLLVRDHDRYLTCATSAELLPWTPSVQVGPGSRLLGAGPFLCFDSGSVDDARDPNDFMAPEASGRQRLTQVFAWSDLLAEPSCRPRYAFQQRHPRRSRHASLAVLAWRDRQLLHRHLQAEDFHEELIFEAPEAIAWADDNGHHGFRVKLDERRWLLLDASGAVRWQGEADELRLLSRDVAMLSDGPVETRRYQLLHLPAVADPSAVGEPVALQIPAGDFRFASDLDGDLVLASTRLERYLIDGRTGKVTLHESVAPGEPFKKTFPHLPSTPNPQGRFYTSGWHGTRLFDKRQHFLHVSPPTQGWEISDAYLVRREAVVIDRAGRLWVEGRHGFEVLLQEDGLRRFGTDGNNLLLCAEDLTTLRELSGNLKGSRGVDAVTPAKALPDFGWNFHEGSKHGTRIRMPGAAPLQWPTEALGFKPSRLLGLSRNQVLLVTASAALLLDREQIEMICTSSAR